MDILNEKPTPSMELCGAIEVRSPPDTMTCNITGATTLPDGWLIVADCANRCIKLFDTNHQICDRVELLGLPYGVTSTGDNTFVITVSGYMLQFGHVIGQRLRLGDRIQLNGNYFHVAHCHNHICLSGSGGFLVLDMNGVTLANVKTTASVLAYIAGSHQEAVVYATNASSASVTCMSLVGNIVSVYDTNNCTIGCCGGMTIHPDGTLYFILRKVFSPYVLMHLTSQCTYSEKFLGNGELYQPQAICCNSDGDKLYIAEYRSDIMKLSKLYK